MGSFRRYRARQRSQSFLGFRATYTSVFLVLRFPSPKFSQQSNTPWKRWATLARWISDCWILLARRENQTLGHDFCWAVRYFTVLHCTALHCTVLHCTALYCTALHCTALHCTALHCTALHCTALHCTALHCTVLYCTVLSCTALHCTALHCTVLHCTALYCTALHCTALYCTVLCCAALHCTVMYCTALHCTVPYMLSLYVATWLEITCLYLLLSCSHVNPPTKPISKLLQWFSLPCLKFFPTVVKIPPCRKTVRRGTAGRMTRKVRSSSWIFPVLRSYLLNVLPSGSQVQDVHSPNLLKRTL